jgi:hypothetical protein
VLRSDLVLLGSYREPRSLSSVFVRFSCTSVGVVGQHLLFAKNKSRK